MAIELGFNKYEFHTVICEWPHKHRLTAQLRKSGTRKVQGYPLASTRNVMIWF